MKCLVQFLSLFLLSLPPLLAQDTPDPAPCGAIASPASIQLMDSLQKNYVSYAVAFAPGNSYSMMDMVPVQVHIIRRSDGTGGITEAEFNTGLDEVNDFFANANMEFFQCAPINFINSDTYFNFNTSEETSFWNTYGVEDVLNIIIPGGSLTTSSGGGLCGYAYLPGGGRDLLAVARSCFISGGNTFAHEVGHYFGLYHTHGKVNCGGLTDELVNGSNCSTAGDDVCDTPADPGLLGIGCTGYLVSNCIYTGSFTDANGDAYDPDVSNIMSYAPHTCRNTLSAGQYARASFYNTNTRGYLTCGSTPSVGSTCADAQPITNNGNYFPDGPNEGNGCENCSGGAQHADWFYYDAPANGSISISSCLGDVNTRLWVYTGSCGNLTPIVGSDDDCQINQSGPNLASEIIMNVTAGTRYYFEWDDRWSADNFGISFSFTTPCNPPSNVVTTSADYSHVTQDWEDVPGAQAYNVRYRSVPTAPWTVEEGLTKSEHTMENLSPCNTLEWQVQSVCNSIPSIWSLPYDVGTSGCADAYCYSYGNSWSAWITSVALSNLSNNSDNGNGYTNFTSMTATVVQGQSYTLIMDSEDEFVAPVYWRVWADLNKDSDFEDPGELLLSAATNSSSLVSGAITIPAASTVGTTRLRISMDRNNFPGPCSTGGFTDVEDYGLIIQPGACNAPSAPSVSDIGYSAAQVSWPAIPNANAYQIRYRTAASFTWSTTSWLTETTNYLYNLTPCTDYQVEVRSDCGSSFSDFSPTSTFSTIGCNEAYCYSYGNSQTAWIDRVNMGAINNISGNDQGYGNYTNLNTSVQPGNQYPVFLQAQGLSSNTLVYWRVWVDLNQDDDFEDTGELLYQSTSGSQSSVSGILLIPDGTISGTTRMRVSMSTSGYSQPCATGGIREVEDYQLTINNPDYLTITPGSLSIPHTGGTAGFSIASNTNWQVAENAAWLDASPLSGLGDGIVTLTATPNLGTSNRTVNVIVTGDGVADQIVAVTQTGAPANIAITPPSQVVTAPAGQTTVQITSNASWTLSSSQSWATLSQTSGTGNATVTVSYSENATSNQRTVALTLNSPGQPGQTATILQNAAATGPILTITPSSQQVGAAAGQTTVQVSSNVSWSANTNQSWATLSMGSGSGNQTLVVTYTANPTGSPRSVMVILSTPGLPPQTATITQAAGTTATLAVTPGSITVEHPANCVNFTVSSNTSWTASSQTSWVTSVTPASGTGNGTITVCYQANNSGSLRIANVSLSGGGTSTTATINQNPEVDVAPWPVTPTGITHTVILPDTLYSDLGGGILSPQDWIGFFYDDNGTPRCAGVGQWDPNNNTAVTVYGDDAQTPVKDGFDEGAHH
ncbi:MAG: GEVED domain-containing protein [Phaeodactylibacter sp.]|uniref:GEVED domain-containing protein n=1 Tax=Phaeodactylibacter sp. TaxID=1940289 RepID=UPI0032EFB986